MTNILNTAQESECDQSVSRTNTEDTWYKLLIFYENKIHISIYDYFQNFGQKVDLEAMNAWFKRQQWHQLFWGLFSVLFSLSEQMLI